MLDSVKEVLTKEIDLREVMTKEIEMSDVKKVLLMEIEIEKLKDLLETEVKMKEFLLKEINLKDLLPRSSSKSAAKKSEENTEITTEKAIVKECETETNIETEEKALLPPFDYGLIEELRKDHKEISFIYDQMMKMAKADKYPLVAEHLDNFTNRIRKHYHRSDVGLYSYLKIFVKLKYPKREKAFNELCLEMKNISIEIFYSISQSTNIPMRFETHDSFLEEFSMLGVELKDRMTREENVLFKMYEDSIETRDIS